MLVSGNTPLIDKDGHQLMPQGFDFPRSEVTPPTPKQPPSITERRRAVEDATRAHDAAAERGANTDALARRCDAADEALQKALEDDARKPRESVSVRAPVAAPSKVQTKDPGEEFNAILFADEGPSDDRLRELGFLDAPETRTASEVEAPQTLADELAEVLRRDFSDVGSTDQVEDVLADFATDDTINLEAFDDLA
jgi:hypothetical protein